MTSVRGIVADWWRSCQYWAEMNATMVVDWYFSGEYYSRNEIEELTRVVISSEIYETSLRRVS